MLQEILVKIERQKCAECLKPTESLKPAREYRVIVKLKKQMAVLLSILLMSVFALSGCGEQKVVLTAGFGKDDVFLLGNESCTKQEVMVYLTNVQNQYEEVYGTQIWKASLDGITLEDNVKEMVLAQIAQIKTMYLMAKDRNLKLSDEEESQVKEAAKKYLDSLNDTEKSLLEVSQNTLAQMYREYALANKLYDDVVKNINPEISDDDARSVTVQHIFFATAIKDGAGTQISYEMEAKQKIHEKALGVWNMTQEENADFATIAKQYSEDETIELSFVKGEMDQALEDVAFSMKTGEISRIIETDSGYHILKCIKTMEAGETEKNKATMLENMRQKAFEEQYDAFVASMIRNLNEELWDSIEMIHADEVKTDSFFSTYEAVCKS